MERISMAKKYFNQARRMTGSLAISVVIYGVVANYLVSIGKAGPAIFNAQTYPLAQYGGLAVSIGAIMAARWMGSRMLSVSQMGGPEIRGNSSGSRAGISESPCSPQRLLARTIILNAGAEVSLLLGMALVFFGRKPYDFIPFAIISLAGFWFSFPRKEQWVSWLGDDF